MAVFLAYVEPVPGRPGAERIAHAFAQIDTPTVAATALEELAAARSRSAGRSA
jgi:hypothetical protein